LERHADADQGTIGRPKTGKDQRRLKLSLRETHTQRIGKGGTILIDVPQEDTATR
jgi:hypothetical protein